MSPDLEQESQRMIEHRREPAYAGESVPEERASQEARACATCLARGALLALLSARIEHAAFEPSRLLDLLCLPDDQLIDAIGGRRREELRGRHRELLSQPEPAPGAAALCRHDPLHAEIFGDRPGLPAALHIHGGLPRLERILAGPVVAILGSPKASDYGMEMAASLARGLARSGVSVASGFDSGICAAVHLGVLEAGAAPFAVVPGGLGTCRPACLRPLLRRLRACGVAVSELPAGFRARRWSTRASERTLAALAGLVIVVEADLDGAGLIAAELAAIGGAKVGALPGRVTSPGARGPHALLRQGAGLVASVEDALDLLYGLGAVKAADPCSGLTLPQRALIERIGAGDDTLDTLCVGPDRAATLRALGELRSRRLLARGDGGRYLPRVSLDRGGASRGSVHEAAAPRRR